jgi:hypothetical protein
MSRLTLLLPSKKARKESEHLILSFLFGLDIVLGQQRRKKKEGDEDVGCTTTYIGGLTYK